MKILGREDEDLALAKEVAEAGAKMIKGHRRGEKAGKNQRKALRDGLGRKIEDHATLPRRARLEGRSGPPPPPPPPPTPVHPHQVPLQILIILLLFPPHHQRLGPPPPAPPPPTYTPPRPAT